MFDWNLRKIIVLAFTVSEGIKRFLKEKITVRI